MIEDQLDPGLGGSGGMVGDRRFHQIADELRAKYKGPHLDLISSHVRLQASALYHLDFTGGSVQESYVVLQTWLSDFSDMLRDVVHPMRVVERTRLVPVRCTFCGGWFNPESDIYAFC